MGPSHAHWAVYDAGARPARCVRQRGTPRHTAPRQDATTQDDSAMQRHAPQEAARRAAPRHDTAQHYYTTQRGPWVFGAPNRRNPRAFRGRTALLHFCTSWLGQGVGQGGGCALKSSGLWFSGVMW